MVHDSVHSLYDNVIICLSEDSELNYICLASWKDSTALLLRNLLHISFVYGRTFHN